MNFFSEHEFVLSGSVPASLEVVHQEPIYYGIQFNYEGPFFLRIDHKTKYAVDGSYAFVTFPGAFFEYGSVDGQARHHNFICSAGKRIQQYIDGGLLRLEREKPLVPIRNPDKFLQLMLSIMDLTRHSEIVPPRAVLLYEELLLQLHESREKQQTVPFQMPVLKSLIEGIRKHPEKSWDFEKEAGKCHISSTHFRRVFKAVTGVPPQQFLIINRLRKATELLVRTTEPVSTVGELCGIENMFYFSRVFKEKYKISPKEYRREFTGLV